MYHVYFSLSATVTAEKNMELELATSQKDFTGNELANDVIYMQHFKVLDNTKKAEFKKRILAYTNRLLNDANFGIVFYKVRIFSNCHVKHEDSIRIGDTQLCVEYVVHFHTFAVECLTSDKVAEIEHKFVPHLLEDEGEKIAELTETKLIIHEDTSLRKPVYE